MTTFVKSASCVLGLVKKMGVKNLCAGKRVKTEEERVNEKKKTVKTCVWEKGWKVNGKKKWEYLYDREKGKKNQIKRGWQQGN